MSKKSTKIITLLVNGDELTLGLRRSKRARNVLLKINMVGEVEVVVPWRVSYRVAEKFAREQASWLQKTIEKKKKQKAKTPKQSFITGSLFPILGDVRQLIVKVEPARNRSNFKEKGDHIEVLVPNNNGVQSVLERWYRVKAKRHFEQRVAHYETLLGVAVNKVVISGARTQWGSCMRNKARVSLQWRLAQAPLYIVDYVIVHEMMHLHVSGHNKQFWSGVEEFCPQYNQCRQWLRENGQKLYW